MVTKVNKLIDKLPFRVKLGYSAVMANIIGFVGIGVSGVALLFAIIALAADKWETSEVTILTVTVETKIGLWKLCIKGSGSDTCTDIADVSSVTDEQENSANACKAMIFLAIFGITGAIVCAVLVLFVMKDQQMLLFAAGGLNFASGFFLMIAMAVYADKIKSNGSDYDYGFALDIIAWLAAWAAGGILIASKFLNKE